jgi:hypothetical protein
MDGYRIAWRKNIMIFKSLDDVFKEVPTRFAPGTYQAHVIPEDRITEIENKLQEELPDSLKFVMSNYDLASLEFGELAFGTGKKTCVETINEVGYGMYHWWGYSEERPRSVIAVALDPEGVITVKCPDGEVSYFHGESGQVIPLSRSIEEFIVRCANLLWAGLSMKDIVCEDGYKGELFWKIQCAEE